MPEPLTQRVHGLAVYGRASRADQIGRPTVVLVHGSMDRGASFVKAIRRMPSISILRYDRRGYGRSVDAGVAPDIAGHVDDLLAIVELVPEPLPCVVVGHSFGGVLALAAAGRRPDRVASIGAFEAPMPWTSWWPTTSAGGDAVGAAARGGPDDAAERFMRRMIGDRHWDRLPASTRAARRAEGAALVAELAAMRNAVTPPYDLSVLTQPIVSGCGTSSSPHHVEAARLLAERAIDGRLVTIDGAAHGAHYSHPVEFAAFVAQVVESVPVVH